MNTVSIASLLFVMIASRTGTTYGHFTDAEGFSAGIGICSVYPNQVEQMLGEAAQHIREGDGRYAGISGFAGSLEELPGDMDLSAVSNEELGHLADQLNSELSSIAAVIQSLEVRANANAAAWETAQSELESASLVLNELKNSVTSVGLNCLIPDNASVLADFLTTIDESWITSETLQVEARTIYETLSGQVAITDQTINADLKAGHSSLSPVSIEANSRYHAAQASVMDASSSYIKQQLILQSQLAQINDEMIVREQQKTEAGEEQSADSDDEAGEAREIDQEPVQEPVLDPSLNEQSLDSGQEQIMDPTATDQQSKSNVGGVTNETTEINPE